MQTTTMSARNKKFWAMAKDKQCISVAKDVLKLLSEGFLKARKGTYGEFRRIPRKYKVGDRSKIPDQADDLIKTLKKNDAKCEVCGIGACFISLVNLGDNISTNTMIGKRRSFYNGISDRTMRILLRKVFSSNQLTLIESAFEKNTTHNDTVSGYEIYDEKVDAACFGDQYISDAARLKAIMKNIIKNKGTFKP